MTPMPTLLGSRKICRDSLRTSEKMRRVLANKRWWGEEYSAGICLLQVDCLSPLPWLRRGAGRSGASIQTPHPNPLSPRGEGDQASLIMVFLTRFLHDGDERVFHVRLPFRRWSVVPNLGWRALGQDSSRIHDGHAVTILRLLHEMRGHDHRHTLLGQVRDALPELATGQRVGAAGRFVEEQNFWLV